eukprot:COSAG06_NODE_16243_length_1011_cov_1.565789_1_plen_171_part_00
MHRLHHGVDTPRDSGSATRRWWQQQWPKEDALFTDEQVQQRCEGLGQKPPTHGIAKAHYAACSLPELAAGSTINVNTPPLARLGRTPSEHEAAGLEDRGPARPPPLLPCAASVSVGNAEQVLGQRSASSDELQIPRLASWSHAAASVGLGDGAATAAVLHTLGHISLTEE